MSEEIESEKKKYVRDRCNQRMPKIFSAMIATTGTPHSHRMMLFMECLRSID